MKMSQIRCYTCLQLDRKLSPLKAQVKFLFTLLCPEMFIKTKDTAQYLICWECEFMADKIKRFQTRLKKANEILELSFKGKTTIIEGLSSLKITAVETINLTIPQSTPVVEQNVLENLPMLPQNVQMLPKIVPSVPQNVLELSLKEMLAVPIKVETQTEVKIKEERHCSNDFDELIQSTTIMEVPIDDSDPLLVPRLKQPAEIEVLLQKPVKDEIIEPSINDVPQTVFIDPPKEEIELREFREAATVTFEDPNLYFMGAEINPGLINKVVKSKKGDELLAKLLSTPSKCDELFLMRQRVPNSNPQKEPECSERYRQHVPNSHPLKESESSDQSSGVASEDNEPKMVILSRTELNVHRDKKRSNPAYIATSLRCERCIEWFHIQEKLDEHNLKHDKSQGNSICDVCEQRFADDSLRDKHYKQHFIVYECHKCPSRYSNRVQLSAHCRMKHDESTFVCKKCFKVFKTFKERSKHIFETHRQRIGCAECGKTYSSTHMLKTHVLNIHKSNPVECPLCKRVVKKHYLKIHIQKTHNDNRENGGYCVECGITYKSKYLYEFHLKNSLKHNTIEKLGLKCDHCDKYFANKESLKNHTEEVSGVKYNCDICNKESKTKRGLTRHMQAMHEGKKPKRTPFAAVCEVCGKSFTVRKSLKEHLNFHLGIRPHVCKDCGATFTYSAALFMHRRLKHKVKRKFEMTS